MNIFDLQATISLNTDGFMSGVGQAQAAMNSLAGGTDTKSVAIGTAIGNMATQAAGALVDFGKEAINTGMSFGAAMSNVGAISGASAEDLERLRESAIEWGGSTKFSAEEVASAFSYMAMAGWDADQMLAGIGGVLNLAAASGEDLATTSDIVTDALTAFGMTAEDTGHFVDVLAATATSANTDVGMLGETFKYVAPLAGTAGYSAEDLGVAIGLMANNGIKASQAGTALRGALTKLVKPSDEAAAAMAELGLYDLAEGAENFQADLTQLTKEMRAVDEKTVALEKAQTKYNTAIEKYGENSPQAVDAMRALDKATYNLQVAEKKLQDGKDAQMRQQFEFNTLLTDSNGEMNSFAETVDVLRTAFSGLSKIEQEQYAATIFGQEAMSGMLAIINSSDADYDKLTDAVSTASDAMGGMGKAAEIAAQQQDNLNGDVVSLQSAMSTLQIRISEAFEKPFRGAVQTATEAVRQISAGISDGGIEGALAAIGDIISNNIGSAFENLMDKAGTLGEALSGLADSIGGGFSESLATIAGAVKSFIDAFADVDFGAMDGVAQAAARLIDAFKNAAADRMEAIATGVSAFVGAFRDVGAADAIGRVAQGAKDLLSAFLTAGADVVESVSGSVLDFVGGFVDGGGAEAIANVAKNAADLFGAFLSASSDIIEAVGEGIKKFLDVFPSEKIGEIIGGIASSASDLFAAFSNTAGTLIKEIADAVKGFISGFDNSAAAGIIADIAGVVGELFGYFSAGFAGIIERIGEAFEGFGERLSDLWNTAGPSMADLGEAVHAVVENIRQSVADFMAVVQPVAEWLASVFSVAVQFAFETLVQTLGSAFNAAMDIITTVQSLFAGFVSLLHGDVAGAVEHFQQAWENIVEFFGELGDMLTAPFKTLASVLGDEGNKGVQAIKAPFEAAWAWFKDIGGQIVEGLKAGISAAWSGLTSWFSEQWNGLVGGVKDFLGIKSPSRLFADIGKNMVLGVEKGWGAEFGGLESQVDRDVRRLTDTARIGFEDSAIGRSSAAGISSMFAASEGSGRGDPVSINLVLDGDVAATALYDPLRRTAFQRGQNNMEAAYA